MAPAQERLPDDGKVVQGPFVMLGRLSQVGGGFLGRDIIDRGQHPHTKARQELCSLKTSGFKHVYTAVHVDFITEKPVQMKVNFQTALFYSL